MVAHHGLVVFGAMAILTGILCAAARTLIPVPGDERPLPAWQLSPAAYAVLAALATVNRLPTWITDRRVWCARAGWLAAVTLVALGCVLLVDIRSGLPSLGPPTIVVVVLTFGAASLVGRIAVWVGMTSILWIVFHIHTYASTANPWSLPEKGARIGVIVVCVISVLGYVVRGGRGPGERGA